jgi:hypothetical protein
MPLTYHQRKERIPFGASARIAERIGRSASWVALVLKGAYRDRRVETALAKMMEPYTSVTEAFGPPGPERLRKRVKASV